MQSVDRTRHDLSHLAFVAGQIGRLQTLSWVPCLPGDGIEMDWVGSIRMSPLRRGMSVDSVVDILSFYVPHRHVYGDDWLDFIEQGWDETVTFATETTPGVNDIGCLGVSGPANSLAVPLFVPQGYRNIWNNYFRPPTTVAERTDVMTSWTTAECLYGWPCAQLKHFWTALLANNVDAADYEVAVVGGNVSLLDIDAQRGYLRTEQEREFFNIRYRDIIKNMGGFTNIDVDDRPQLLMRNTIWASGYDVDGTSETSLGQYSGRVAQAFRHRMPRFHCPEHGCIWTVALVRYPVLYNEEQHFLFNRPQPTYAEISGDPAIIATQPPFPFATEMSFSESSSTTTRGYIPYGQWYRTQPPNIHVNYDALNGFPFIEDIPASTEELVMVSPGQFDDMYQTTQLGHYQIQARNNCTAMRRLPSSRSALLAGVN